MTKPVLLCILDGVGLASPGPGNAVTLADTPFIDKLFETRAHSALRTDGPFVGLPEGEMGNSEVGHMTIGSGRIIRQSLEQVRHDLANGTLEALPGYSAFKQKAKEKRAIHLIGLISSGGVHSHMDHIVGIAKSLSKLGKPVYIHGLTDGRDTDPQAAKEEIPAFVSQIADIPGVELVSLVGRYYGMDRDGRWERMEIAWKLWTQGIGEEAADYNAAIAKVHEAGKTDEFLPALNLMPGDRDAQIQSGDAVMVCNFRADRARQIVELLMQTQDSAKLEPVVNIDAIATLTEYKSDFPKPVDVLYPNREFTGLLGDVVAAAGLKQLRISETEKYAHVTYYLNCGRETPFDGEDRILVDSPREVATYDEKPEMSLPEVSEKLIEQIHSGKYSLIVLNIANGDQVGHSGNIPASLKAMEFVDKYLSNIVTELEKAGGEGVIIADHGNIEELLQNGEMSTAHSMNPVPCIYIGNRKVKLHDGGLKDVAPTMLDLIGLPKPSEMEGNTLIES